MGNIDHLNPVLAEIIRGGIVESRHRGSYVVCNAEGTILMQAGDHDANVFPRSAIKAFQCLPVIESGAADRFGLNEEEIALCCSSHNGEKEHVRVAASILRKAGVSEASYECGAHWPYEENALLELAQTEGNARAIHNNCSGKHAGMLALAKHLGVSSKGYTDREHPVQREIAKAMGGICGVNLDEMPVGIDGCSVPTWAFPLTSMATGFARLAAPGYAAGQRIIQAVRKHPFMVAGTNRFDTKLMELIPRLFIKVGAEGVFCGAVPDVGLGFALKCDDGAGRAAEVAIASMLQKLGLWTAAERLVLEEFSVSHMKNWRKLEVGLARASF